MYFCAVLFSVSIAVAFISEWTSLYACHPFPFTCRPILNEIPHDLIVKQYKTYLSISLYVTMLNNDVTWAYIFFVITTSRQRRRGVRRARVTSLARCIVYTTVPDPWYIRTSLIQNVTDKRLPSTKALEASIVSVYCLRRFGCVFTEDLCDDFIDI